MKASEIFKTSLKIALKEEIPPVVKEVKEKLIRRMGACFKDRAPLVLVRKGKSRLICVLMGVINPKSDKQINIFYSYGSGFYKCTELDEFGFSIVTGIEDSEALSFKKEILLSLDRIVGDTKDTRKQQELWLPPGTNWKIEGDKVFLLKHQESFSISPVVVVKECKIE